MRGYGKNLAETEDCDSASLGTGASFHLSEAAWWIRIGQAWLSGFLDRSIHPGHSQGRITTMGFNTRAGENLLMSPFPVTLPAMFNQSTQTHSSATTNADTTSVKNITHEN